MNGNQIKTLISKVSKGMTKGIPETDMPGKTSKGFSTTFFLYTSAH
jgi:hypothetical protein